MPGRPAEAVALDGWAKVEDAWFCGGCRGPRFTSPFHHFTVGPFDKQRRRTCGICAELWEHPRHHRPERVPERYW
jgi:hypothetical protein